MGDEKKKADEKPEQTITLTMSALNELISLKTRESLAEIMTAKTPDERMTDALDQVRGKNRPPIPEEIVACRSPLTGATFKLRVTKSKTYPQGRVVEMIDYERPAGWDVHREDGGLCDVPRELMRENPQSGKPFLKFAQWLYDNFWRRDWNEVHGKPFSFLAQWSDTAPATRSAAE